MSPLIISFDVFTFPRLLQIAGLSLKVACTLCQKSELEYWDFFEVIFLLEYPCFLGSHKWQGCVSRASQQKAWRVDNDKNSSDLSNDTHGAVCGFLSRE